MAPLPRLFGGKKRAITRRGSYTGRGPRYRQIWFDEIRYRKFELIAMSEGRTISSVAADIAEAGFATYLSAKITKEQEEAEERRRLGLPVRPDRSLNRMKRESEKRGWTGRSR